MTIVSSSNTTGHHRTLTKYLNDELKYFVLLQFFLEVARNSLSFPCSEKSLCIPGFPGLWQPCVYVCVWDFFGPHLKTHLFTQSCKSGWSLNTGRRLQITFSDDELRHRNINLSTTTILCLTSIVNITSSCILTYSISPFSGHINACNKGLLYSSMLHNPMVGRLLYIAH